MGIIARQMGKVAKKALFVAAIYGGKRIAVKMAGKVITALAEKTESAKSGVEA